MIILSIIKKIISWLKEHTFEALLGAIGIGAAGAGVGAANAHQAKRINGQALEIHQKAIEDYERENQITESVLVELGKIEKQVLDSFPSFCDAIEKIQERPSFVLKGIGDTKTQKIEPVELKKISADAQMAIAGAGGVGVGTLAGLAVFGTSTIIAAPAVIGGGLVICFKGISLKNKAIKNRKQALATRKSVDEIISFFCDLRFIANSYRDSIINVYNKYVEYLQKTNSILSVKTKWCDFTKDEKTVVHNAFMLAGLLHEMIKTDVIIRSDNEKKIENINKNEIEKLQKDAIKLLNKANRYEKI